MKKLSALLFLAALVCLCRGAAAEGEHQHEWVFRPYDSENHQVVCAICGEPQEGQEMFPHSVYCSMAEKDVCLGCGARASEGAVIQIIHNWKEKRDEFSTWRECATCGEVDPGSVHYHDWKPVITEYDHRMECACGDIHVWANHETTCDHPDACAVCGAKVSDGAVITYLTHVGEETPNFNRLYHWTECSVCGEKFVGNEYHTADCLAPDVCLGCGHTVSGDGIQMETVYHGAFRTEFDTAYHWHVCEKCGQVNAKAVHAAPCYSDVCPDCLGSVTNDGIVIGEVTHPSYTTVATETTHQLICQMCGQVFQEEAHFALCFAPNECAVCGAPYEGNVVHERMMNDCVPVDDEYHQYVCFYCEQKVLERHQFRDGACVSCFQPEPVKPTEEPSATPTMAPTATPTPVPTAPPSGDWRVRQTVCSLGIRFRDIAPKLTDKWYMFTPVDLSQDGTQTIDLIAANISRIGRVTLTVTDGVLTVEYQVNQPAVARDMAFTLLPDLSSVQDVDITAMKPYAFGQKISVAEDLNGDTRVLLYLLGHADYDFLDERISTFSGEKQDYKTLVNELKQLMD